MGRLEGKRTVVTGAARGIGRAIARKFLVEGAQVLITDVAEEQLQATAGELAALGTAAALAGDLTDPAFSDALVRHAQECFGRVDVLVNNAGIALFEPFLEHSLKTWDSTMNINLRAMFILSQLVARAMVTQGAGGTIINMASSNGHVGERRLAAYNASKAGVLLLTKTMALELAAYNIRVNAISPGFILTDLAQEAGLTPALIHEYVQKIPLQRHGRPEEVADLCAYLASDEASFITGESVVIDGGQLSEE